MSPTNETGGSQSSSSGGAGDQGSSSGGTENQVVNSQSARVQNHLILMDKI